TLTTSPPGVSILQGTADYGAINAGSNVTNGTPFVIAVNSTVLCGNPINFILTVNFSGGVSPKIFQFSINTGTQLFKGGITSTLGTTPPSGSGYTVVSGQQTGRLFGAAPSSSCGTPLLNPGFTVTTGLRQYDAYTFINPSSTSQCVTVTLTSPNGLNVFSAAYNDSGFVSTDPRLHFLAKPAQPAQATQPQTYSFNVAAGKSFTVVVHDVNIIPASNSPYRLSLSLASCSAGPSCTPVVISMDSVSQGATGIPYNQAFAATGGSGSYSFAVIGSLPAGLSFTGNVLSGTPTQAGTFPIKVVATDLTGCPADTNYYSLVIAGIAPASITVTSGTPQQVLPLTAFPEALQVIVRDTANNGLSGVNVVFSAPGSGASGTFEGGLRQVTIVTDSGGIAIAPTFTANDTTGAYVVTAAVVGVADALFSLTNFCPADFVVTSNADSGRGTLREIISKACAGIQITFDSAVTNIILTRGELRINKAITIIGPGASRLTISGNNNSRIFNISAGTSTVSISGLTLRNGRPSGNIGGGGAILINNGVNAGLVNITRCVITNNTASFAGNLGGGIDNEGGTVVINQTSIINNTSTFRGGAIQHQGFGSMVINNSTIAGNTADTTGIGGGIRIGSGLPLTLNNCTIIGNTALTGGNISILSGTVTFGNTIIAGGALVGTGGVGPNINGSGFISKDYNLVDSTSTGIITGITTNNIIGVSPRLLPLANYGGGMPTFLPMPGSPVVNAGNPDSASGTDQRGFARVMGARVDMGAVEANYSLTATAGADQATPVLTQFPLPLQATLKESGNSIAGVPVIFSAPASDASGLFANLSNRDTAITKNAGLAISRVFTANHIPGTYSDTASIGSAFPPVTYTLTNTAVFFTSNCQQDTIVVINSPGSKIKVNWVAPNLIFPDTINLPGGVNPAEARMYFKGNFNGHGYYESVGKYDWTSAKSAATEVGAHLVTITSATENSFVHNYINQRFSTAWIGLYNTGNPGNFAWVTGEPVSFTNWIPGEPNNFYGSTVSSTVFEPYVQINGWADPLSRWNDIGNAQSKFIAEYDNPVLTYRQYSGPANGDSLKAGTYTVCYEKANTITGKRDSCCFTITVVDNGISFTAGVEAAGLNKVKQEKPVFSAIALPNPSRTAFSIKVLSENVTEKIQIQVADVLGRMVEIKSSVFPGSTTRLGGNYLPGIYFARVMQGKRVISIKLVKQ
ncbi:MAG: choice-of-anchor Q domain-containing protein, partial [Chitinophagaceae bacterium]